MENYSSNSHRSRGKVSREKETEEKPKIEKVVNGNVRIKKKNEIQKFADIFMSEDLISVKNYILHDVIIPAAKKTLSDAVSNGIEMMLWGEARGQNRRTGTSKRSYTAYYDDRNTERRYVKASRDRSGYSFDDIIFDSYGEADDVLTHMDDLMEVYKLVRVADLYDLAGVDGPYTHNDYGWTDIRSAKIVRAGGGYMIKLPRPLPLD